MPNVIKIDLLNAANLKKVLLEKELSRLYEETSLNIEDKINATFKVLADIAMVNAQIGLIGQYYIEPQQANVTPTPQVHQGQTHGE